MSKLRLFSNEIPPACQYCKYGFITRDGRSVLCEKKGVTSPFTSCRRYRYAPAQAGPQAPPRAARFRQIGLRAVTPHYGIEGMLPI